MKRVLLLAAVCVVGLAGCGGSGAPPTAEVTMVVANQAGMPMGGVQVRAQQLVAGTQVLDLEPTTVTAGDGTARLGLPVNAVVSVGLSAVEGEEHWQQQILIPSGDVDLYYQYPVTLDCPVVDPLSGCP